MAPIPANSGVRVERGSRNPERDKAPVSFWVSIGLWCFFTFAPIGFYLWFVFFSFKIYKNETTTIHNRSRGVCGVWKPRSSFFQDVFLKNN